MARTRFEPEQNINISRGGKMLPGSAAPHQKPSLAGLHRNILQDSRSNVKNIREAASTRRKRRMFWRAGTIAVEQAELLKNSFFIEKEVSSESVSIGLIRDIQD